jgi:DNA-3-methyladenine glycosylase II
VILHITEPLEWTLLLEWLGARAIPGLESVEAGRYRRVLADGGVLEVGRVAEGLAVEGEADPVLVARLFDADHDAAELADAFVGDPLLSALLARAPGIRVPGTWSGFELAVRAVLGQQVSVAGARKTAEKLVELHGGRFPEPEALVAGPLPGMPTGRERALRALAEAAAGGLRLDPPLDVAATRAELLALPGFGPWTVEYIAMRALRDRDAWPASDLHLRRAAAGTDPERWRPWRAYAAMLLWQVT